MPIHLVLAADPLFLLEPLENLLQREPDFHLVARCQSAEATLHAIRQHRPDVLILDRRIPGKDDLEVLREMRKEKLRTRVVLLIAPLNADELLEAVLLGVGGVVQKERTLQELGGCIRKVYAGDQWLDSCTVGCVVENLLRRELAARERARSIGNKAIADRDQRLG
jgi:two-component system, NarL family, nitrate/nitrite response regulator NarL